MNIDFLYYGLLVQHFHDILQFLLYALCNLLIFLKKYISIYASVADKKCSIFIYINIALIFFKSIYNFFFTFLHQSIFTSICIHSVNNISLLLRKIFTIYIKKSFVCFKETFFIKFINLKFIFKLKIVRFKKCLCFFSNSLV